MIPEHYGDADDRHLWTMGELLFAAAMLAMLSAGAGYCLGYKTGHSDADVVHRTSVPQPEAPR